MPEEDLRDIDITKQQSGAGTAVSSNTGPSFQIDELSSSKLPSTGSNFEPKSPSRILSNTIHSAKHCDDCGLDHYYNSEIIEENAEMNTYSQPARSLRLASFCGVTLNQAQRGQLSEFHILENDGDTEMWSREWETMAIEVGGPEVMSSSNF